MTDMIRYVNPAPIQTRQTFTGSPIFVYTDGAGDANQVAISPPIAGLNATNVQDAIAKLAPKEFSQPTPAAEWLWNHNLGFRPKPQVFNLAYQMIDAEVQHISENQLRVRVSPAMPGYIVI
jgi:hypothetical protein